MFKWLEQYFTFSKGERNAIVVLLLLCTATLIIPRIYLYFKPAKQETGDQYLKDAEAFAKRYNEHDSSFQPVEKTIMVSDSLPKVPSKAKTSGKYFDFDPNKVGVAEWVKLGFTEKQAITIEHYKVKGAKFYVPQDLKKLYVMSDEHYNALLPYVKIDANALPPRTYRRNE